MEFLLFFVLPEGDLSFLRLSVIQVIIVLGDLVLATG